MYTTQPLYEIADHTLVEQMCAGDQSSFEKLIQRYQHVLYRFVRARVGNEQADDVLQFVWMQLYLSMQKLYSSQSSERREASAQTLALSYCLKSLY